MIVKPPTPAARMPKFVDHTYQDFSRYLEEGGQLYKHKKSGNNFPARLHKILSDAEYSHLITWMPHGRAWKILDRERFVRDVIPKFFSSNKYHSFCRQLNWWGFKRLCGPGSDMGCYYHQCFLRDLPQLTCLIRRTTTNEGRLKPHIESEPNLYKISEDHPLPHQVPTMQPLKRVEYCGSEEVGPSTRSDTKKRCICLDNDSTELVQHVVSTSSFVPANYHANEFSGPAAASCDPEELAVAPWASSFTSSGQQDGYHNYPPYHHHPNGFLPQYHPPPHLPAYWVPHGQSGLPYHHAAPLPDNGNVQHGDSLIENDHGWAMFPESFFHPNFIDDRTSGIIDSIDSNANVRLQGDEQFDSSDHNLNDPYAPLPVEFHENQHRRHHHRSSL